MLSFGITIPATVLQRSEILEGLTNYPVYIYVCVQLARIKEEQLYCKKCATWLQWNAWCNNQMSVKEMVM
jgi:hypothetical protein